MPEQGAGSASAPLVFLLARSRLVLAVGAACALVAGTVTMLRPRRFEAAARVAAVTSSRLPGGLASLAAISGLPNATGLLPTPDLIAELAQSSRVLAAVAATATPRGSIGVMLTADSAATGQEVERALRRVVQVGVDRRSGLVTVRAAARDTALARAVAQTVVDSTGAVFGALLRSQARQQREGLAVRVDSARAELARAEEALQRFAAANRVVAEYSVAAVERQRLTRRADVAAQSYASAVAEQQAALGRELESAPVLAVVDPVPATLRPLPRYSAFYALAAFVIGTFGALSVLLLRGLLSGEVRSALAPGELTAAVRRIPVLGGLLTRGLPR